MFIDSHCHLDFSPLCDDLEAILTRAGEARVTRIITIGTDLDSSRKALDLAAEHETVSATVGVHPHDAKTLSADGRSELLELARDRAVAIGEIGLDFHYDHSPRSKQREVFVQQIELAGELGLPVVIHSRDAAIETLEIIKSENVRDLGGVMHCFSYDYSVARRVLDLNLELGVTGIVTFKGARELHEVVRKAPLERLLIETDAPYLAPVPHRGKTNEPAFVVRAAEEIAAITGRDVSEVAEITTANAVGLFNLE